MQDTQQKKKILIVEDDDMLRDLLGRKLAGENFAVVTARNGEEAVSVAASEKPNLILLDLLLPGMDGVAAMKQIRSEIGWGDSVPIIIFTNLDADERITKAVIEYKPSYYFTKSGWKIEDVVQKVKETLNIQ